MLAQAVPQLVIGQSERLGGLPLIPPIAAEMVLEDRALVRPMATALSNRMVHVALQPDVDAWLAWGASNGVHPLVLAFVRARPDRLFELPPSDATPAVLLSRSIAADGITRLPSPNRPANHSATIAGKAGCVLSGALPPCRLAWLPI